MKKAALFSMHILALVAVYSINTWAAASSDKNPSSPSSMPGSMPFGELIEYVQSEAYQSKLHYRDWLTFYDEAADLRKEFLNTLAPRDFPVDVWPNTIAGLEGHHDFRGAMFAITQFPTEFWIFISP